jgi:hypothetical protein
MPSCCANSSANAGVCLYVRGAWPDADWLAERGGFEPPVPLGLTWVEFGPILAHYLARTKASMLERICSPGVRLRFGSLRFPSFARLMLGIR